MSTTRTEKIEKNHLIFDGECSFCRKCVELISEEKRAVAFHASPYQEVFTQYPEIGETAFSNSVHLKLTNDTMLIGAEAIFYLLKYKFPYNFCLFL